MNRDVVVERIGEILVAVEPKLDGVAIGETQTMSSLGLDSLKLVEIGVRVEDAFGTDIVFDDWLDQEQEKGDGGFSVGSLTDLVVGTLNGSGGA